MSKSVKSILAHLQSLSTPEGVAFASRYCKTGPGEYAEGDIFLGLRAATMHELSREYQDLGLEEATELLRSPLHEARSLALLIWVRQTAKAGDGARRAIYNRYLENTRFVNNWDLVDCSAPQVVGAYLFERSRRPLHRLVKSKSLWERRIAMVATQYFIRQGDFEETLALAAKLTGDKEDLIHKATGWMLREVGKRDQPRLEAFLKEYCQTLPRTALRYAIERFPEARRKAYLRGET